MHVRWWPLGGKRLSSHVKVEADLIHFVEFNFFFSFFYITLNILDMVGCGESLWCGNQFHTLATGKMLNG